MRIVGSIKSEEYGPTQHDFEGSLRIAAASLFSQTFLLRYALFGQSSSHSWFRLDTYCASLANQDYHAVEIDLSVLRDDIDTYAGSIARSGN
jgi:hypothetical protein